MPGDFFYKLILFTGISCISGFGAFVFFVGFVGCCGAWHQNKILLGIVSIKARYC